MNRIKSVRQKNSLGTFDSAVPFGTDGNLVDMASGLNNEQELKLGGNHIVSFSNSNEVTTITEQYKDEQNSNIVYTVQTVITPNTPNEGDTSIETSLWEGTLSGSATKVKTTIIPATGNITEVLS